MIRFMIQVINSCNTEKQLSSARKWIEDILRRKRFPRTNQTTALFMPMMRALLAKEEELRLKTYKE